MIKRFIITFTGFITVVALLGVVKASQIQEMASMDRTMPLTAVTTAAARKAEWNPTIKAIGSLAPVQGVTISAELEGAVTKIAVESGAAVSAGDLLIKLDTMVEEAQLDAAKARADLAKLQVDRALTLSGQGTMSASEYDSTAATYAQARADVAAINANIAKKTIRAPFDGRVGIRQVNLGQFVSRGTPLIPLQKLDPVFVNFYVPQRSLPLLGVDQAVSVSIDAFPGTVFEAHVSAINPEVDRDTRNVWVQATLPNPGEKLRAGMFAKVEVTLPQVNEVAITQGLDGSETVATSGVFKLRNGLPVQINNGVIPSQDEMPKPPNT